ncbi:MAG: hypothetical protein ABFS39_16445 [Pseudomonadota bacterium]
MSDTASQLYSPEDTSSRPLDRSQLIKQYLEERDIRREVEKRFRESQDMNPSFEVVTSKQVSNRDILTPNFNIAPEKKRAVFQVLQEWEGHVIEVCDDHFSAELVDITADESVAMEEADFSIDEVSGSDTPLVKPGGVFRWSIGYLRSPGGTKKRVSQIVFRRLPLWTKKDLQQAESLAVKISGSINWE